MKVAGNIKRTLLIQREYFSNEILKNRSLCATSRDQVFALGEKELD